jgi:hypothetical protein
MTSPALAAAAPADTTGELAAQDQTKPASDASPAKTPPRP